MWLYNLHFPTAQLRLNFFLDLEHASHLSATTCSHLAILAVYYPFQQFYRVHYHPNKPVQNHLEHNLENILYNVWHEMKLLNLLPKIQLYYLKKESKHHVTHHLLRLLLDFSLAAHLPVSLELCSLFLDVLSSHNSSTLDF